MTPKERRVPKIRFPEFEWEWERKALRAYLQEKGVRNTDGRFSKDNVLSVSGDVGVVSQIEHLGRSYAGASVDNYHVVEKGDVVYTKSPLKNNPYGIIKANKRNPGIVSTLYAVYEVLEKHSPEFIDRYFELDDRTNAYLRPLVHKGAKNDMKINNKRVLIDPVCFPEPQEQKKIAAFLGAVDAKLQVLRSKRDLLTDYKRGVMRQLFSQKIRITRDDGSPYPDWEEKKLGDVIETFSGGTPVSTRSSYYSGEIPFIKSGEIWQSKTEQSISETALNESSAKMVIVGDLLYALYGATSGEVAISKINGAINQAILCIRTSQCKEFLYQWFLYRKERIKATYLQGGQGNLSADLVKSFLIDFPHPNEQKKIADFLSAIDAKIDVIADQVANMKTFKKGLLQQMFV